MPSFKSSNLSVAKLAANPRHALKSTGAKTTAGKRRVARGLSLYSESRLHRSEFQLRQSGGARNILLDNQLVPSYNSLGSLWINSRRA